jgi:hypothetical protein
MADVLRRNEVYFDGKFYPIEGNVRTSMSSQYPGKVVLGDVDKDSNPRTSIVVWDDWRGGIGQYSTDGKEGLNKSSFSTSETRFKNHLTLPKLQTAAEDLPATGAIYHMEDLAGWLYCTLNTGTDIYYWRSDNNTWSGQQGSLPTDSTSEDSINFRLGGTTYIAFAHTRGGSYGYSYSADGSNWTPRTKATKFLTFWDERLWGIYQRQLWFSTTIDTEVDDAVLPAPRASVATDIFIGPDAKGEDIIYVTSSVGLYAHDAANSRFVKTKLAFPSSVNVKGATWNGEIYVSAGAGSVYRYDPVAGTVRAIGVDKDAGLPSAYATDVELLIPAHTGLLMVLKGTGTDSIWEYNGVGWHLAYKASGVIYGAQVLKLSDEPYRLYVTVGTGDEEVLNHRPLDVGTVNPDTTTISYEGTDNFAIHETPWFNAGQNEIDKTAIRVRIECTGMTSTETVKVEFALDYSSLYQASTFTVSADGVTTNTFPLIANNNNEAGSVFRAIRFKLTLNRGSTATLTPNIKSLSLEWRRKLVARYGFSFDINRSRSSRDKRTPTQMKADIITAIEKSTQVELAFLDEAGTAQNYFVDATMEDRVQTGKGEYGLTRIVAVEN